MAWAFSSSPSKRFAIFAVFFSVGIAFAPFLFFVPLFVWTMLMLAAFIAFCFVHSKNVSVSALVIMSLCTGILRFQLAQPSELQPTLFSFIGKDVRIEGVVDHEVETTVRTQSVVLDELSVFGKEVQGKLLVTLSLYPSVTYADHLVFRCEPEKPEPIESFAYDRYLRSHGILAVCIYPHDVDVQKSLKSIEMIFIERLLQWKTELTDTLALTIPEPHAAFLSGLLFGGSSALSPELRQDFQRTGLSHILAASGFNVSLFSLLVLNRLRETSLGRTRALSIVMGLLVLYALIAGLTAPIVRATLMAAVVLVGLGVSRRPWKLNLFLFSISLMLLHNPMLLAGDVGFQLSASATAGILFLAPEWKRFFTFIPERFGLQTSFVSSVSAITLTTPIVLWHFAHLSLIAPLVNLIVLSSIPYLMAFTIAHLIVTSVSFSAGIITAAIVGALSSLILHLIQWTGTLSFAYQMIPFAKIVSLLCVGAFLFLYAKAHLSRKTII